MPEKPQLPKSGVKRTAAKKGPAISVVEFLALKNPKGNLLLSVEGETVSLTSLERIYWPAEKFTKFDLLRYYIQIAPHLLPHLKDRPAILQRWPRGINAPMFFQQDLESAPSFVKSVHLTNLEGRELDYAVFSTTAALLHLVNLGNIEQHPWHSTTKKLSYPDWIALDLDPKKAPWQNVLEVALLVKQVCDEVGLSAFPKTSGSSGIHIYLPLKPKNEYGPVAEFSRLLASEVASRAPKIATVERSLAKRGKDQVYVDWMQNARGKSLASVFTVRAKPGATVSMPLTWKQVEKGVKISDFNIKNVPALIEKKGNAWEDFFAQRQTLKLK
ncbi:MAG TPA: non-homologous end-joining DNA ligase [Pyrinomonadaceae bacterium]|nr:non-homologous end-joining DNA ligase [Pyrinomonadaceae bacterium]